MARIINALTDEQRAELGIVAATTRTRPITGSTGCSTGSATSSTPAMWSTACGWTPSGWPTGWPRPRCPTEFRTSSSVAVDGTDVETWGALHGDAVTVDLDGEAAETQLMDDGTVPKPKKPARKAQVLGVGADGRKQYTVDPDARAGHRSATNSRPAGPYVGYELHLAVQARDVRWTNGVDKTSLSDEVPGVVTCFSLVPAGTHRGKAIVDDLIAAKTAGEPIDDVVWDPGYSLCKPGHRAPQAGPGRHPPDLPARHPPARHPPVLR